jgi:hypothetical protein
VGFIGYRAEKGHKTAVYTDVQERIMRQALEAMWFEGILDCKVGKTNGVLWGGVRQGRL